jgi:hypothetical protein
LPITGLFAYASYLEQLRAGTEVDAM